MKHHTPEAVVARHVAHAFSIWEVIAEAPDWFELADEAERAGDFSRAKQLRWHGRIALLVLAALIAQVAILFWVS